MGPSDLEAIALVDRIRSAVRSGRSRFDRIPALLLHPKGMKPMPPEPLYTATQFIVTVAVAKEKPLPTAGEIMRALPGAAFRHVATVKQITHAPADYVRDLAGLPFEQITVDCMDAQGGPDRVTASYTARPGFGGTLEGTADLMDSARQ